MTLLGKVDAVLMGVLIFAMGLTGGWSLRDRSFVMARRGAMLLPDKTHGVYCVIKGADVVCRFAPPDWSSVKSAHRPNVVHITHTLDALPTARHE
jgi:hypothetical protein